MDASCRNGAAGTSTIAVNRPPAITWHRMHMNETDVALPERALANPASITCVVPSGLRFLDEEITEIADSARAGDRALTAAFDHARASSGHAGEWETGLGEQAAAWLAGHAVRHLTLEAPANRQVPDATVVRIDARAGRDTIALIDVVARAGSQMRLVVQSDSREEGSGLAGSLVRIVAESGARVELDQLQTLPDGWRHLDDVGIYLADDARVDATQTVLGASASYIGLACNLAGYRSSCTVDTRYVGHAHGALDFNYVMRQRGAKSRARLMANGVLADASRKILRGTIDLAHGCKGAVGREAENVLLVGEKAANRTLPVILCDEDDVQGDHGATIGHVNPEQLGYLRMRGLSPEQAEALFLRAAFDRAVGRASDGRARQAIERRASAVLGESYEAEEGSAR